MSRFKDFSNDRLRVDLKELVKRDRILEAELVSHLGEVEARHQHLEQGCSSMFDYCVKVLGLSKGVAYKRIGVAPAVSSATSASSAPVDLRETGTTEALGAERYVVRFTADERVHAELQELRSLFRHSVPDGDIGKILAQPICTLLEQVRKRKIGARESSIRESSSGGSAVQPLDAKPCSLRRRRLQREMSRPPFDERSGRETLAAAPTNQEMVDAADLAKRSSFTIGFPGLAVRNTRSRILRFVAAHIINMKPSWILGRSTWRDFGSA